MNRFSLAKQLNQTLVAFAVLCLLLFGQAALAQQPKDQYKTARDEAEALFAQGEIGKAKLAYEKALKAKAGDKYAADKITECTKLINTKFAELVAKGDAEFKAGNLSGAKASYEESLKYIPADAKVLAKIEQCNVQPGSTFAKIIGGKGFDEGKAIAKLKSGGYVVVGRSSSFSTGGDTDLYAVKLNADGSVAWEKTFGGDETEEGFDVIETADGNIVAVGYSDSYGAGPDMKDMWVVKMSQSGQEIWSKTYMVDDTSETKMSIDEAHAVVETADGSLMVVGSSINLIKDNTPSDVIVLKVSSKGDLIWKKAYGGPSNELGNDIVKTAEGFAIVGSTESYGKGNWDVWLVGIDANGEKKWDATFGGGDNEMGNALTATSDGGFVVTGYTYSFAEAASLDAWLIKTDGQGKQQWARAFGDLSTDESFGVVEAPNGDFVAAGHTVVWVSNEDNENISTDGQDVLLICVDKTGKSKWVRNVGGSKNQRGADLVATEDGSFMVVGFSDDNEDTGNDLLVLKVNATGLAVIPKQ